jgi:alpha-glucosidase (family GH31 glycosyl hydrolase)
MKKLGLISGFAKLPPIYSLGFHYSKWEKTSPRRILTLNRNFEKHGFPLDALWMDIGYTNDSMYFVFND